MYRIAGKFGKFTCFEHLVKKCLVNEWIEPKGYNCKYKFEWF